MAGGAALSGAINGKGSKRAGVRDIAGEINAESIVPGISAMERGADAVLKYRPANGGVLKVRTLDEVLSYEPQSDEMLVGDGVIEAGNITLLFGPPGSFKGFAVGQLAMNGARGSGRWLGFEVNCQFRTLWINCENGDRRMKSQFARMEGLEDARDYVLTTSIPAVWNLSDGDFVRELRQTIVSGGLRLIVLDTVSNFAGDEMAKDFAAFFSALNAILQGLPHKVAVLLIHHSRKPKDGDKGGRGLLHLISGHQMLQRRARCILYLGRVTEEQNESRVIGACLKCSDNGEAEKVRVPLQLNDKSELAEIPDFDWSEWGAGSANLNAKRESKVTEEHLNMVFEGGHIWLSQKDAAAKLMDITAVGRSASYEALKVHGGRFSHMLKKQDDGKIGLRP